MTDGRDKQREKQRERGRERGREKEREGERVRGEREEGTGTAVANLSH